MTEHALVDLSYPITDIMAMYPGQKPPLLQWSGRMDSEGYNLTTIEMGLHTGTHVDAPLHQLKDGSPIDAFALERFAGKAVVFRRSVQSPSFEISVDEVEKAALPLNRGDIFLLDTGAQKYAGDQRYYRETAAPSLQLCDWLVRMGIGVFASDIPSIDRLNEGTQKHRTLLSAGIPLVENLRNLGSLPAGVPVTVFLFPLLIPGREAAPCRAVALKQFVPL